MSSTNLCLTMVCIFVNTSIVVEEYINMQKVKTLIDKAVQVCGTQTELALRLGLHKSQISGMKRGTLHIAPELAILIADIANQNVTDAALAAIIENTQGTDRGEKIQAIVGRSILNEMLNGSLIHNTPA